MSTTRSPVKSSRPGSVSDAQHQTKASSSQRDPKEPSKAARRLPSLSSDKDDSKKSTTSGKPPSKQQHARIRTISESSDKLGSEDGETQKKSKAELKAERRALQVINSCIFVTISHVFNRKHKELQRHKSKLTVRKEGLQVIVRKYILWFLVSCIRENSSNGKNNLAIIVAFFVVKFCRVLIVDNQNFVCVLILHVQCLLCHIKVSR